LNIFENETQALGMHSDTHSQWSENPGSRDRNPLRAQDHHKAKMGDPVWSFEENDLRHVLKAKHCLLHPSGSVPQGISALDTHSEFLDTLKALGNVSKENMIDSFPKLMQPLKHIEGSNFGIELQTNGFFDKALSSMLHNSMCVPCGKAADWNHLNLSKQHKLVQEVIARCNYMCRPSTKHIYADGLKLPKRHSLTNLDVYR
jgi:hypothetical protein